MELHSGRRSKALSDLQTRRETRKHVIEDNGLESLTLLPDGASDEHVSVINAVVPYAHKDATKNTCQNICQQKKEVNH